MKDVSGLFCYFVGGLQDSSLEEGCAIALTMRQPHQEQAPI